MRDGVEEEFDALARIAAEACDVPIALVTLVEADHQRLKANIGFDACEIPRDWSFCAHAILDAKLLVVRDATLDQRFAGNPLVESPPAMRFYAGAPLVTSDGYSLGTLCVLDYEPRELTGAQLEVLETLAREVTFRIEASRHRRAAAAEWRELALTDELTRLPNRRLLRDRLQQALARLGRHPGEVAVLFLDLDGFKRVNDLHGHDMGDRLLAAVAERLRKQTRGGDTIARYGGDEFVAVSEGVLDGGKALAARMRAAFDEPFDLGELSLSGGASVGVVTASDGEQRPQELIAAADRAMYGAKGAAGA